MEKAVSCVLVGKPTRAEPCEQSVSRVRNDRLSQMLLMGWEKEIHEFPLDLGSTKCKQELIKTVLGKWRKKTEILLVSGENGRRKIGYNNY